MARFPQDVLNKWGSIFQPPTLGSVPLVLSIHMPLPDQGGRRFLGIESIRKPSELHTLSAIEPVEQTRPCGKQHGLPQTEQLGTSRYIPSFSTDKVESKAEDPN